MGVRLPAEYQEVQYIEGTGTQYIVTDINLSTVTNPSVDWTLKVEITAINKIKILAGADDNLKQIVVMNSDLRYDWCSKSTTKIFYTKFKLGSVFTIMQKDGFLWLDNESHEITTTSTSALKFGLFCKTITNNGVETSTISNMKLYSFEVKQDFTDIAKYVPCYRKADSKPGMYDLVSGEFFTNAGTGEFLVGPDVIGSISPWLVARRRMLMRKPSLNTSPRIAEYGKHLSRSNTATTVSANYCYTEWYDLNFESYTSLTMKYAGIPESSVITYQYRNTETGAADWYYFPNKNTVAAEFNQIRFSIAISNLRDCYLYFQQTGEILFAGKDTIYYGHKNISEIT